jgi:malate synthase
MTEFDRVLGARPNQVERRRDEVSTTAKDLLDVRVPGGEVTEAGLRTNVSVGIQYVESWLRGTGAAAINNLMEDAATAEISRSQVWQWVRHGARLEDGRPVTPALVREIEAEELKRIEDGIGTDSYSAGRFKEATALFEQVALNEEFVEFLTVPAYEHMD